MGKGVRGSGCRKKEGIERKQREITSLCAVELSVSRMYNSPF